MENMVHRDGYFKYDSEPDRIWLIKLVLKINTAVSFHNHNCGLTLCSVCGNIIATMQ